MSTAYISAEPVDGHGPSGTPGHGPSGTRTRALRNATIGPSGTPHIHITLILHAFLDLSRAVTRARVFNFVTNQKL